METEAKYRIVGPVDAELLESLDWQPYRLATQHNAMHHDEALDTADHAVTGSGHALRIRREDGRATLTLKSPGQVNGAVHQREEIEAPLPPGTDALAYHEWPPEIGSPVAKLVGDDPLAPLLTIDVHRITWKILRGRQVIGELALDNGVIHAGKRSLDIHELEVELKGHGGDDDLQALEERLRATLAIAPEHRSKLQRGLALLRGEYPIDGHSRLDAVGRRAIKRQVKKLRENARLVRARMDADAIHDMRVATRRLRAIMQVLEEIPQCDAKRLHARRNKLKPLAASLGAARDLDVLLQRVDTYTQSHEDEAVGLVPLRADLEDKQREAREALAPLLRKSQMRRHYRSLKDLTAHKHALLANGAPGSGSSEEIGEQSPLVRHMAGSVLLRRYEHVLAFESVMPSASDVELHQLRIACKRFRYALEFFAGALGPNAEALIATVTKGQDELGDLHDLVIANAYVTTIQQRAPDDAALAAYRQHLNDAYTEKRVGVGALWQRLSGHTFRADLESALATL